MTLIASGASLLHAAAQDLHDGKRQAADRLPGIADAASDAALVALLRSEAARADAQAGRLRAAGLDPDGPANLWIRGILDDAERDARSTEPGRLLDIALIGAIRKAKAAEIVSSDTAVALARASADERLLAALEANRDEEVATDHALRGRLATLAGAAP